MMLILGVLGAILLLAFAITILDLLSNRVEDRLAVSIDGADGSKGELPPFYRASTRFLVVDVPLSLFAVLGCKLPPMLLCWLMPIFVGRLLEARADGEVFGGMWSVGKALWLIPLVVVFGFPVVGATANALLGRHP